MRYPCTRTTNHDRLSASDRLRLCVLETMTWLNLFLTLLLVLLAPLGSVK
jgi:hypothetical protein